MKTGDFGLVDIEAAAQYLGGISTWTVRGLIEDGHLSPIRLPSARRRGEQGRRLLLAIADLDALIERSKAQSTAEPNRQLSRAAIEGWKRSPARKKKGVA